jgi:hypothetical protein
MCKVGLSQNGYGSAWELWQILRAALWNYGRFCERPCGLDHVGEPDLLGQSIHKNPITSNSNRVSHKFGKRPMQAGSRDHGELMQ